MKKIILFIFTFFAGLILYGNVICITEVVEEMERFTGFFDYKLGGRLTSIPANAVEHTKANFFNNYSIDINTNECEEIEFAYDSNVLVSYSIKCVGNFDVKSKINKGLHSFLDDRFACDGFYTWYDSATYVIYDVEKNTVTIAMNVCRFFSDLFHCSVNYSPFVKDDMWTELYKKEKLYRFMFIGGNFDQYVPYLSWSVTYSNNMKYAMFGFKSGLSFFDDEEMAVFYNFADSSILNADITVVEADVELVFYKDTLLSYNIFFKDNKQMVVLNMFKRFGVAKEGGANETFGIWETNDIRIVIMDMGEKNDLIMSIIDKKRLGLAMYNTRGQASYSHHDAIVKYIDIDEENKKLDVQ